MKKLKTFYDKYYSKIIYNNEELYYDKLSYILPYEAIDMTTNIEVNIQEHFIKHLYKYVNIIFDSKNRSAEITKSTKLLKKNIEECKAKKKEFWTELNKVKKDLVTFGEFTSDSKYHTWLTETREKIFPGIKSFEKGNLAYDIKSNTKQYLYSMFYLNNEFERLNEEIVSKNTSLSEEDKLKEIRLFNVLPLRTNIIGKHICLDTCGLIMTFMNKDTGKLLKTYKQGDNQVNLWKKIFKLDKSVFRKNLYKFHHMIRTDGISCSILFIRVDKDGKPLTKKFSGCTMDSNTDYIENIDLSKIKDKRIVCADPGKSDLIYCGSKNVKLDKLDTFSYTQAQRNVETRTKKYKNIMDKINKETLISDEKSVKMLETTLSNFNSKTSDYTKFELYLVQKNKVNYLLYEHYETEIFRKFKLNRYTNTQKSESKMIKNFSNKFGTPDKTVFVIGDYDKGSYNMKGCEPAICKKFRRIFKNAGYQTYLIGEFRTSKISNCCNTELEKFHYKPHKNGKNYLCFGLLRCKSVKPQCETIHNRDKNAVLNMLNIVSNLFTGGKRPEIFTRQENS